MAVIQTADSLRPKKTNKPLDQRTVVATESEIANITLPAIGLLVYVVDTKKVFKITALNEDEDKATSWEEAGVTDAKDLVYHADGNKPEGSVAKELSDLGSAISGITNAKGAANGIATLDADGKVPSSQLPSFVDDVLEFANTAAFPSSGESGKIYVALDTNLTYRWSGSAYVEISQSLALGETESTAYPGSKGKANADTIAEMQETLSQISLNLSEVETTANSKYALPSSGIPSSDLSNGVQTSLEKANTALQEESKADFTTATAIGELPKGTDLTGKTATEILTMMLDAEYAPKWSGASASLSGNNSFYLVGSNVPTESSFTTGGSAAKAEGKTTATGGAATDTKSVAANTMAADNAKADFGSKVVKRGTITIKLSRAYAKGSSHVVSSKGNNTNKTAGNATTKLANAEVNNNIDADYKIKAITATASSTIYFGLPVYIDGSQPSNLSYSGADYQKDLAMVDAANPATYHHFEVPSTYTNVKVQYVNPTDATKWVDLTVTETANSRTFEGISYKKYTFGQTNGATKYRLTFTIA